VDDVGSRRTAIRTAGAKARDYRQILPVVPDYPRVGGVPGRAEGLPDERYAERGYDSEATRTLLRWLGIEPQIAKRKAPHGSGLAEFDPQPSRTRYLPRYSINRLPSAGWQR
jgi:hypothetical protein